MTETFAIFFRLPFEKETYKIIEHEGLILKGTGIGLAEIDYMVALNIYDYT